MNSLDDYDEFGNYIGAALSDEEEEELQQDNGFGAPAAGVTIEDDQEEILEGYNDDAGMDVDEGPSNAVVLQCVRLTLPS